MNEIRALPTWITEEPPIGRYGGGKLDLIAIDFDKNGIARVWACLIENGLNTQEFYYWDNNERRWIDKSIPSSQGGDASRVRVPYKQLIALYEQKRRRESNKFLVTMNQDDADALFVLMDLDSARGIDDVVDAELDILFSARTWKNIVSAVLKVQDASGWYKDGHRFHDDPSVWTMFCIQWTMLFSAVLYGKE